MVSAEDVLTSVQATPAQITPPARQYKILLVMILLFTDWNYLT